MKYWIRAIWDEESKVFISKSNIVGLHLEAETLEEFQTAVLELAPELIIDNHIGRTEPEAHDVYVPIEEAQWNYGQQPIPRNLQHA